MPQEYDNTEYGRIGAEAAAKALDECFFPYKKKPELGPVNSDLCWKIEKLISQHITEWERKRYQVA